MACVAAIYAPFKSLKVEFFGVKGTFGQKVGISIAKGTCFLNYRRYVTFCVVIPMQPFILSDDEVYCLTDYSKPALQCKALESMGVPFLVARSGKPKVLRESVMEIVGVTRESGEDTQPNFSDIKG